MAEDKQSHAHPPSTFQQRQFAYLCFFLLLLLPLLFHYCALCLCLCVQCIATRVAEKREIRARYVWCCSRLCSHIPRLHKCYLSLLFVYIIHTLLGLPPRSNGRCVCRAACNTVSRAVALARTTKHIIAVTQHTHTARHGGIQRLCKKSCTQSIDDAFFLAVNFCARMVVLLVVGRVHTVHKQRTTT